MVYYFAWVGPTDTVWDPAFKREDESVFSYVLDHSEGDFPSLEVDIKNPRRKFIASGQNIWVWFSRDDTPLFYGRLVAMPEDLEEEIIRVTFIARPVGYDDLKRALADTMKVRPFWDPIWINEDRTDDPDVVWEAYPELWHVDRVSLALTSSNIINGEDGTITFGPDDFFYEGLDMAYSSAPLRKIRVEAEVSWDQRASGTIDISNELVAAFASAGSGGQGLIHSLTGQGLEADWPEPGTSLSGGWSVANTTLQRADGVWVPTDFLDVPVASLDPVSEEEGAEAEAFFSASYTARFFLWKFRPTFALGYDVTRSYYEKVSFDLEADVQPIYVEPGDEEISTLSMSSRKVSESLGGDPSPDVLNAMQLMHSYGDAFGTIGGVSYASEAIYVDAYQNATADLGVSTSDPRYVDAMRSMSDAGDTFGTSGGVSYASKTAFDDAFLSSMKIMGALGIIPLRDRGANSYLKTDRGLHSLEYLIAVARAELLARSRAVEVSFETTIDRAIALSCRKNVIVNDSRLPGGQVAGKVMNYSMRLSGEDGKEIAVVAIGCTVGYGSSIIASDGTPTYAEDGYSTGYEFRTAANYAPIAGEVTYNDFSDAPINDDGFDFTKLKSSDVLIRLDVINGEARQREVLATSDSPSGVFADIPSAIESLNAVFTEVWLELRPLVGGPFETSYPITVSKLMIPKTIEL